MQSYFTKKLRRQSKQHDQAFTADNQGALDTAVTLPPAPAASTPSEEPAASPVLDEEDEKFLQRLAAIAQEPEGTPPPLPERRTIILEGGEKVSSKDAQQALLDGADTVPLPTSPPEVTTEDGSKGKGKAKATMMSYFSLAQSKFKRSGDKDGKAKDMSKKEKEVITDKDRNTLANDIHAAAEKAKSASDEETKAENKEPLRYWTTSTSPRSTTASSASAKSQKNFSTSSSLCSKTSLMAYPPHTMILRSC